MKVILSHNWDMEISSLGLHKFRRASTGTFTLNEIDCNLNKIM